MIVARKKSPLDLRVLDRFLMKQFIQSIRYPIDSHVCVQYVIIYYSFSTVFLHIFYCILQKNTHDLPIKHGGSLREKSADRPVETAGETLFGGATEGPKACCLIIRGTILTNIYIYIYII